MNGLSSAKYPYLTAIFDEKMELISFYREFVNNFLMKERTNCRLSSMIY